MGDPRDTDGDGQVSFAEYQAAKDGTASTGSGSGGTVNKTAETTTAPGVGGGFGLSQVPSGMRSPDRIDLYYNDIPITTSVGVSSLPAEQLTSLQAQLVRAGLTPSTYRPTGTLDKETQAALLELKHDSTATGLSDMDTLRQRIETQAQVAAGAYGSDLADKTVMRAAQGAHTETQTQTQHTVFDPLTARSLVKNAMTARLGREPTADEYHDFRQQLSNSGAGQDTATTTTRYGRAGNAKSSSTTHTPGPEAGDVADQFVRQGALGREGNTVQAASFFDIINRKVEGM